MVLDGKPSQEYLPDDVIFDIPIDADASTLYSKLRFDNLSTSRTYVGLLLLANARFWICVPSHVRSFVPSEF